MEIFLQLLIYGLACYRITQMLVNENGPFDIFIRLRSWLVRNAHRNIIFDMFAKLFSCKYCMGIWVAFLLVFLPGIVVLIFAVAGVQSLVESFIDK